MRIFLDKAKIRGQYIPFEILFGEMQKNTFITLTRIHTHSQRDRDTQHVSIYRRSRLSISNVRLTVQNKSSRHQTCIRFPPTSCQKKTFEVYSHGLCSFVLLPFNNCQETQHSGEKLHQICTSVTIKLRTSQKLCV